MRKYIWIPCSNSHTEQPFDQSGARNYAWHVFHCETDTFAFLTCVFPSVLSETGIGAVRACLFVVRSVGKTGGGLIAMLLVVLSPARNKG